MKSVTTADLGVNMAGIHFRSPIGVGPVGFPWGKEMPKEPELHAEVLLKHVKAGAGYICLTAMFLTEPTIKKLRETAKIEERHFMPEHGTAKRAMKAGVPVAPYGLEGMFYIDTPFWIGPELAVRGSADTEKLVKILVEKKPKDVPLVSSVVGLGNLVDTWVDGAKRWEELGAEITELNMSCPIPATLGGAVDDYFQKRFPARFQGALIADSPEIVEEITREVVKAVKIPVGVKISPETGFPRVVGLAKRIRDAGAKYVHTFNSAVGIAAPDIYNGGRPLWPFADGNPFCMSSGSWLRFPCYRNVAAISRFVPGLEIAAAGGLVIPEHCVEVMMLGATLAQPCTGVIEQGRALIRQCDKFMKKFMVEQGYHSVQEFIGLGQQYIKNSEDVDLMGGKVIAELDEKKCTKCGRCVDNICVALYSDKGKIKINVDKCGGCGGCIIACPSDAIKLVLKA
ncbi:4Fe-4S binding protein [Chloroflexota bacterium]